MCGFVLLMSTPDSAPLEDGVLQRMTDALAHRGPDDAAVFTEGAVAIGFRRLSIFDLAASGRQPMLSEDGRHVIAFNGAIYNFIELRAELRSLGHTFRSRSDTEVLLAAWRQWGAACLQRLNGMWAFVVYDRQTGRVFGARDRFGIKPMFWFRGRHGLAIASEIKAIRDSGYARLSAHWPAMARFLLEDRLDDGAETFYTGVQRVPAGTCFEVDTNGRMSWQLWWSLRDAAAEIALPSDPTEQYRALFDDAVRLRMRSDVRVGVLLSGGLDSTAIICRMAALGEHEGGEPLAAICYRDPEFDEQSLVEATLQQTKAKLYATEADPDKFWSLLGEHLWHQDEPVHSFSSVAAYELMRSASQHGVKVVLNGQGADEVLAGYPSFFWDYWAELMRAGQLLTAHRAMMAFAQANGQSALRTHASLLRRCFAYMKQLVPGHSALALHRRKARMDANTWISQDVKQHWQPVEQPVFRTLTEALYWSVERAALPLYLRVEDRNSMAHGVEARLPFLDYRLVSLAFRLGSEWKLHDASTKVLLRMAMRERIPEPVRARLRKFGFPTATENWFRGSLYQPLKDLLATRAVRESGLWNVPQIDRALDCHRSGKANLGGRLFDIAQVIRWMDLSRLSSFLLFLGY